jgi:general transcription factor 3C polypeptide 5 (transcription factor C subunit 1)
MDRPTSILRKLKDNVGKYAVEAVAEIRQTHRFRGKKKKTNRASFKHLLIIKGLADFHQSTTHSDFFSKFRDTALTGNSMRHLSLLSVSLLTVLS